VASGEKNLKLLRVTYHSSLERLRS